MARSLSEDQVRLLRMRSQRLAGARPTDVGGAVRGVGAVQAQNTRASRLAVRARSEGLDAAAVVRACNEERVVVRTWLMRGTLHMVPARDVGWLVDLLRPPASAGRRRRLELGLDDELCARALPAIREVLGGGRALTRAELVRELAAEGVAVDPKGQAPAHLVGFAARQGLICRGPDREDDEPTYVLLEEWVGEPERREPDDALGELARRYVGGHGPVTVEDFASWAGLPLGRARRAFQLAADELEEVAAAGGRMWVRAGTELDDPDEPYGPYGSGVQDAFDGAAGCVRLLGAFDAYLLGYRDRSLALAPRFARRIQAGGGIIHPAVVVDGRVVGAWRASRKGDRLSVVVEPFERLDRAILPALEVEVADVGRFLGVRADLTVEPT